MHSDQTPEETREVKARLSRARDDRRLSPAQLLGSGVILVGLLVVILLLAELFFL